jgi:hypothetical protein
VVVEYWPHGLTLGFVLAGGGLVSVIAFFVVNRRRRGAALAEARDQSRAT